MKEHPWQTILGQAPSKSNSYRLIKINGHASMKRSDAIVKYEDSFYMQMGTYRNLDVTGYFELHIRVYFTTMSHDLDNSLKVVLDCLQRAGAVKNDNRCVKIIADKFLDKLNPRVEFRLVEV